MRRLWLIGLILGGAAGLFGQAAPPAGVTAAVWQKYLDLNKAETRLSDFRDSDQALAAKLVQLGIVNASRQRYGASPVELDILASRVANRQSTEGATANFRGHWNLRGEKPYHRWAFAGGTDHVSENAYAYWSSAAVDPNQFDVLMKRGHDSFMAEKAPNDGHLKTVIAPNHTHVGLGFATVGTQFRYYEEFVDRYFDKLDAPKTVAAGQKITIAAKPKAGYSVYALIAYYEAPLQTQTADQVNAHNSYPDFTSEKGPALWPTDFSPAADGSVSIPLSFAKKGLYYVQIYLNKGGPDRSGSYTTTGKTQGSGLVIQVQ